MKKLFITAAAIIIAVFFVPAVTAFAADKSLEEIPVSHYYYSGSSKAYCYTEHDSKSETYKLYYINQNGKKLIYKTKNEISDYCVSGNGFKVFYAIENKIYQYSLKENKIKMIFDIENNDKLSKLKFIRSSDNGEYCFVYWSSEKDASYGTILHNGKSVTDEIPNLSRFDDLTLTNSGVLMWSGINDYYYFTSLYTFNFDNGKSNKFTSLDDMYNIKYFGNIYIMYNSNKIYKGKIGSEPKLVYSGKLGQFIDCDGKGDTMLFNNEKYIFRIDLNSGKRFNIAKNYSDSSSYFDNIYDYFIYSSDFNSVAYIDCDAKKLVRLSRWNAKSNSYIQRTELDIIGNKTEYFGGHSSDMNVILLNSRNDENDKIITPLIFENGNLRKIADITKYDFDNVCCDRFGHLIGFDKYGENSDFYTIAPDGSKKLIFTWEVSEDSSGNAIGEVKNFHTENGFITFSVSKTQIYNEYGDECGGTEDIYYIDENGKAVLLENDSEYEFWIFYD